MLYEETKKELYPNDFPMIISEKNKWYAYKHGEATIHDTHIQIWR